MTLIQNIGIGSVQVAVSEFEHNCYKTDHCHYEGSDYGECRDGKEVGVWWPGSFHDTATMDRTKVGASAELSQM